MSAYKLDIKNDTLFKNIFLRDIGKKYLCSIISELLEIDYESLVNNIRLYSSEHPNIRINNKSSFSDIIYEYKNKIFIIEMNNIFTKKLVNKNYFYLLFRHTFDANNENDYNKYRETYLIDIDNFDIVNKMNLNIENRFIYKSLFKLECENISLYENIKTFRINLDYLRKRKYNCSKLTNIERDCLIFVENNKNILRKQIKNRYLEGVIDLLEVIEIDGKYFPLYDKEEWDAKVQEEAIEIAKTEGHQTGLKQGIEQGLERGLEQSQQNIIKNMYNKKYTLEQIVDVVNIPLEKVKSILNDIN